MVGSAVWVYGDQVNDHGEYTATINGSAAKEYTGRSGCGGGYGKECEKLHGLMAFYNDLPAGVHNLTITNGGPATGDVTYFGMEA